MDKHFAHLVSMNKTEDGWVYNFECESCDYKLTINPNKSVDSNQTGCIHIAQFSAEINIVSYDDVGVVGIELWDVSDEYTIVNDDDEDVPDIFKEYLEELDKHDQDL